MKKIIAVLLLLLSGCGNLESDNNHGYGYEYTLMGESGLRVRYIDQQLPEFASIESVYREVMSCTGITATGPLLIITDKAIPSAEGVYPVGGTYLDTGTVLIVAWVYPDLANRITNEVYRHEFVHYLLQQSGFDIALNNSHQSPLFQDCVYVGA